MAILNSTKNGKDVNIEDYSIEDMEIPDDCRMTVTRNGVIIFDKTSEILEELIEELQDHIGQEDLQEVIEAYVPIFEQYPWLRRVPIGAIGTMYKYECAGETYVMGREYLDLDLDKDTDLDSTEENYELVDHVSGNVCEVGLEREVMLSLVGGTFPERGGVLFYLTRDLEIIDTGYDPE